MAVIFLVLLLLILLAQRWSMSKVLNGVDFDYTPSRLLVAPGEKFELTINLSNHSRRFVPFIRVEGFLPAGLTVHDQSSEFKTINENDSILQNPSFSYSTYLMPRSGLRNVLSASISRRGRFSFRGARLWGGDFLGWNENRHNIDCFSEVVVYPKECESTRLEEMIGGFFGDLSVRRFIIEDPVLTAGFREYTGREPMKAISWTQSARTSSLVVKNYDYTTEASVTVLLNVECEPDCPKTDKEMLIESCYSLTHTVCRKLEERRVKYDFYTNALTSGALASWSYIGEGLGRTHFETILEGLGRASYELRESLPAIMKRLRPLGTRSLIIITPTKKQRIFELLNQENLSSAFVIPAGELMP